MSCKGNWHTKNVLFMNYHQILGVSANASADEIKKAYRQMSMRYHPDKNPSANAAAMFVQINQAYQELQKQAKKPPVLKTKTPSPTPNEKPLSREELFKKYEHVYSAPTDPKAYKEWRSVVLERMERERKQRAFRARYERKPPPQELFRRTLRKRLITVLSVFFIVIPFFIGFQDGLETGAAYIPLLLLGITALFILKE
jgi:hypothetical protein